MEYDVKYVVNYAINGDIADLEKAFDSVMQTKINGDIESRKQHLGQSLGRTEEE